MIDNKIIIPNFPFKVGEKVLRNGEILYISDIVFSLTDFKWLIIVMILDAEDIILKTTTIPFNLW